MECEVHHFQTPSLLEARRLYTRLAEGKSDHAAPCRQVWTYKLQRPTSRGDGDRVEMEEEEEEEEEDENKLQLQDPEVQCLGLSVRPSIAYLCWLNFDGC
jgi:hypothetical protein